jgi:hypothetical protein
MDRVGVRGTSTSHLRNRLVREVERGVRLFLPFYPVGTPQTADPSQSDEGGREKSNRGVANLQLISTGRTGFVSRRIRP